MSIQERKTAAERTISNTDSISGIRTTITTRDFLFSAKKYRDGNTTLHFNNLIQLPCSNDLGSSCG
jgi:hypothetical protein